MPFPKLLFTLCVAAILTAVLPTHADDNAAQAAARAAVLQRMQDLNGTTETNMPVAAPAAEPAATVVAPVATPPVVTAPAVVPKAADNVTPSSADSISQAAARAATLQKIQEMSGAGTNIASSAASPAMTQPAAVVPATAPAALVSTPTTPAKLATPAASAYPPIVGPDLPITADQQSRLKALDAKYYENQISPRDYFKQREAILNGQ